jgi:type I restriction enzyme S subunit
MSNITKGGELDLNNVINVDASDTEVDNYSLQIDDFLFNTRNSRELVGKNTVVKHYFNEHILFNNNIMRVRFSSIANPRIISYYLNSPLGNSKLEEIKKVTTNVAAIYAKDLNNIFIPIPPLKEQQRIVDKIESLFGKLDNAKELIEEAREDFEKRKSAILEKAFRGELTKEWRNINSKYNACSELESIKENK